MKTVVRVESFLWIVMTVLAAPAAAGQPARVAWQTDVATAWATTRESGRPLLVFVTRDRCAYCTLMKERTYGNAVVAGAINRSFVPLVLDGTTPSPLLSELGVGVYPSTYIISPQAVVLARIDGYVPPETLAVRLSALRPAVGVATAAKGQ